MKRTTLAVLATVLAALALAPMGARADETVEFNAQVRHRLEIDNRDFDSDTGIKSFNLLRTRIGATFMPSENVKGFVQFQDSRVWGEEPGTLAPIDNIDLHQGFFVVKNLFDQPVDLKAGRMEFNLGPQRLIGAVGWSNVGRAFDGAMLRVRQEKVALNFFSFTETELNAVEDQGDKFVHGAYADLDVAENYTTQLFWIWQRRVPARMLDRHTIGFYAARKGRFHHETEFAMQLGSVGMTLVELDSTETFYGPDVSAFMAALSLGYGFPDVAAKPDVTVGVDYLSGDDNPFSGDYKSFDTMYATNHKYYGFMDYFLNIPLDTYFLGLIDYHGRLTLVPAEGTKLLVDYHYFTGVEEVLATDEMGRVLDTLSAFGSEVDVTLSHKYDDNVAFSAGASMFVPTEVFEFRGEDTSTWFYLQTIFSMK